MHSPTSKIVGLGVIVGLGFGCASGVDPSARDERAADAFVESEQKPAQSDAPLRTLAERVRDPAIARRIEARSLALLPVEVWPGEFRVPLRLRIEWPGGRAKYEVLLERGPGTLVLRERTKNSAGKAASGFRLALVTGPPKSGAHEKLEVEPGALAALPFAPAHLLADVQRAFYPWLLGVPECGPCERSGWRGDVAVWERVGKQRIIERRLAVPDLLPYGNVRVRYAQKTTFGMPSLVALENGWIGYRLVFEALEPGAPRGSVPPATATAPESGRASPATDAEPASEERRR